MYSKNDYRYYLENRLAHSDDYLAHYGVQGMHWGVRKAENYRTKELAKLDKTYENRMKSRSKKQAKLDKKLSKHPENAKVAAKSVANKKAQKYIEAMYKTERKNLKKMNATDLQAEKRAVTKEHIKDAAISGAVTAGSFGLAAAGITPVSLVYARSTDTRAMKSNRRVSAKEVNDIRSKYGDTPKEYRPAQYKSDSMYKKYKAVNKTKLEKLEDNYKKGAINEQEYLNRKQELQYW